LPELAPGKPLEAIPRKLLEALHEPGCIGGVRHAEREHMDVIRHHDIRKQLEVSGVGGTLKVHHYLRRQIPDEEWYASPRDGHKVIRVPTGVVERRHSAAAEDALGCRAPQFSRRVAGRRVERS